MFQNEYYTIPYSEFTGNLQVSTDGSKTKFTYTMTDELMKLFDYTTGTFTYHGSQFNPILKVKYLAKLTDEEAEELARSEEKENWYSNEVEVYYNGVIVGQDTCKVLLTANCDVPAAYEVTYKVVNGTWSDGSTADKKETVQSGSKPAGVPTGMKANSGYTGGAWDTAPTDAVITGATTFTYTFTAKQEVKKIEIVQEDVEYGIAVNPTYNVEGTKVSETVHYLGTLRDGSNYDSETAPAELLYS